MTYHARRLTGRLFYCLISLALLVSLARAGSPATTTITDIVYRADGTPASGAMLISWPAFASADGYAVAAGSMNLTIGSGGAISVALVPNAGSNPAGSYYKVVYQLADGTTATEYWSVPSTSPTTIAAVRSVVVPSTVAGEFVSKAYVDSQVASRAADSAVVHLAGAETVIGLKTFSLSPSVPAPVNPNDAASKSYVDSSPTAGVGACPASQYVSAVNRTAPTCRSVGAQQFADQYASIQTAITAAGSTGQVVIPPDYAGTDSYTNPQNINIVDRRGKPDRYKGFVNVVSDCGAKGDGLSDDGTAIQNCLNANPGRKIFFPKMCASQSGGGSQSCIDYVIGTGLVGPLKLSGNGQWLEGETPDTWQGAPVIWIARGATPGGILIPSTVYGARISNLEIVGSLWPSGCIPGDPTTWSQNTAGSGDGITIQGGEATLENVIVNGFWCHGIDIDGSLGGSAQPDFWTLKNVQSSANEGDGLYIHGGDSNVGLDSHFNAYQNCGWAIQDASGGGNTHIQPHSNSNHRDEGIAAGAPVNISSVTRSANVVSVVTSSNLSFLKGPVADTGGCAGCSWLVVSGVTDTSYNGVFQLTTLTDNQHFTYRQVGANSSSSSGTVGLASSTAILTTGQRNFRQCAISSGTNALACGDGVFYDDANIGQSISIAGAGSSGGILTTTISGTVNGGAGNATLAANAATTVSGAQATVAGGWGGGPYNSNTGAGATWINPYQESNQPPSKMTNTAIVIGGNFPTNFNFNYGIPLEIAGGANNLMEIQNPFFNAPVDAPSLLQIQAGVTADQDTGIELVNHSGIPEWKLYAPTMSYFGIRDLSTGTFVFDAFPNGRTDLLAQSGSPLNLQSGETGNIQLFGGISGHSFFPSTGNLVQNNDANPALTLAGSTADYGVIYNGAAADSLSVGFTSSTTANPASAAFTVTKTGNPVFGNSTAHALLVGEAGSAVVSLGTGVSGQCLLSGGSGADPAYGSCGGVAGAGGSNTQVQYNNSGSLAGIANLTSTGTVTTALSGADWLFADPTTNTKKAQFDLSNITAANTRTINIPDANSTTAQSISAVAHNFLTTMSAQGVFTQAQPAFTDISGTVPIAQGGTSQTTAAAARGGSGLNIDELTTHGDSNYNILSTDRVVATSAAFTVARTWTLPAANALNAGQSLLITDLAGGVSSTNTLTVARGFAGTDTIDGQISIVLNGANQSVMLTSDGNSKWAYGVAPVVEGGTGQTTAAAARGSSGLDVDELTTHGDSTYNILSTDRVVATSAALTAPRTWFLPAANSVNPGQSIYVVDLAGGVSSTNTLTIGVQGADTMPAAPGGSNILIIATAYGSALFTSDGVSKWLYPQWTAVQGGTGIRSPSGHALALF